MGIGEKMIQLYVYNKLKKTAIAFGISLVFIFMTVGCAFVSDHLNKEMQNPSEEPADKLTEKDGLDIAADDFSDFSGEFVVECNYNVPEPDLVDIISSMSGFEYYSELDELGRCGVCYANLSKELMPKEERGEIGHIKPSGWQTAKYADIIMDGLYLFNRCHLIAYQLSGENDNPKNLITGTRYMNTEGMLPYENMVSQYIQETNHHVYYRVTPVYEGKDLVAKGVQMEAYSLEDNGTGICFNVFIYNIQPGIQINYATGDSKKDPSVQVINANAGNPSDYDYILNIRSGKFHYGNCCGVSEMKEHNKEYFKGTRKEALELGYEPCGTCKP